MKGKRDPLLVLIFILIAGALYFFYLEDKKSLDTTEYRVIEVLDGDTVIIDDARRSSVRYLGIDTPEVRQRDSPGEPMAEEAKDYNEDLVGDKQIKLEFDEEKYDVYGRMLAHVYVDGVFVNLELLREGLATDMIIMPNSKHADSIHEALSEAKKHKRGIWGDLRTLKEPPGNRKYLIDISKAHLYSGKRVVAEGEITETRKSDKLIVLKMDDLFDIKIFESDWPNFSYFAITPDTHYKNKRIRVIGRVKIYKGTPGIIVGHPLAIRVIQ
jgi:endonuclease YncB( thermonuclease family)